MRTIDQGGWGRDDLILLPPAPALANVVEFFWIDEWSARRRPTRAFRIVADDAPHLIWHLRGGRHRSASLNLVGARSTYRDVDVSARLITVGVRLRAGVLPALTGRSARHFTDRSVPMDGLLRGRQASAEQVIDTLSDYLDGRVTADTAFVRVVRELDPRVRHPLHRITATLGGSERSLRNMSRNQLGMSLKRFMRIRRLHSALMLGRASPHATWSRVASESGYADQAHLIRDCRALLGETPAAFLRRGDE